MKYYQSLVDGRISVPNKFHKIVCGELYTECEMKKYGISVNNGLFREVRISQKEIYWLFGARFPFHENKYRIDYECHYFHQWN
ncbi:MAG: hypothetical protein ACI4S2_06695 [Lachnospiraceae bacterium]